MPILRVELGNEVYLDTPVLVVGSPPPRPTGARPPAGSMPSSATFPHAQVAVTGRVSQAAPKNHRQAGWTRRLLKTLHGEAALTFHTYWRNWPRGPRLSGKRLWAVFSAPIRRLGLLHDRAFRQLPRGVDVWLTEWTPRPSASMRGTWAHGLSNAEYLLGLLGERRVRQEDLHALILKEPGGALFSSSKGFGGTPGTVQYARTAVGAAFGELHPLLSGGAEVRELDVRHAPHIPGTRLAAVRAVAVKDRGALLLNLTAHHRLVPAGRRAGLRRDPGLGVGAAGRSDHGSSRGDQPRDGPDPRPDVPARLLGQPHGVLNEARSRNPGGVKSTRPALDVRSAPRLASRGSRLRVGGEGEATCLDLVRQSPF